MKINTLGLFLVAALALCAGAGLVALGVALGPLNPPSGPVSSTSKTLAEIEPRTAVNATNTPGNTFALFRITQPGSYYLTSNISIPNGKSWGIEILGAGVTLDLNGYTIDGAGNTVGGIILNGSSDFEPQGVRIRNGTITNVADSGIAPGTRPNGAAGMIVENVRVLNVSSSEGGVNGVAGIYLGRGGSAINCYVANAPTGITTSFSARVINSTAEFCTFSGFDIGGGSVIENCVAVGIAGGPTNGHGFVLRTGAQATGCNSRSNTGDGFVLEDSSVALDCSSSNNTGAGYRLNSRSRLDRCIADVNTESGVATTTSSDSWSIERCMITGHPSTSILVYGLRGHITNNVIRSSIAGSIGISIHFSAGDMVISGNSFGSLTRAVQCDGRWTIVTNNTANNVSAFVVTTAGDPPHVSNFVAPVLAQPQAATATNPFANIKI